MLSKGDTDDDYGDELMTPPLLTVICLDETGCGNSMITTSTTTTTTSSKVLMYACNDGRSGFGEEMAVPCLSAAHS